MRKYRPMKAIHNFSLMEQYPEMELAERYPASYLLLSMLGKV